jgi:PleD family two-component response regulator
VATRDGPVTVTVSAGCTIRQPHDTTAVEALLERADRALMESKAAGRNRVRIAG